MRFDIISIHFKSVVSFFVGDGHIKLVDFGLAKGFERGRQKLNFSVVGTVDYMAPEIAAQCGHTQSADWWSFGIFAFDLFYGKPPDVSILVNVNFPSQLFELTRSRVLRKHSLDSGHPFQFIIAQNVLFNSETTLSIRSTCLPDL